jgi:hypothetical protein
MRRTSFSAMILSISSFLVNVDFYAFPLMLMIEGIFSFFFAKTYELRSLSCYSARAKEAIMTSDFFFCPFVEISNKISPMI